MYPDLILTLRESYSSTEMIRNKRMFSQEDYIFLHVWFYALKMKYSILTLDASVPFSIVFTVTIVHNFVNL